MMGYGLLPDGTLPTLSDLENENDPRTKLPYKPQDILALRAPEGRKFIARTLTPGRRGGITIADVEAIKNDITKLNKVLDLREDANKQVIVYFEQDVSQKDRNFIINLIDKHESSKRSGNRELLALQNTVVRGIFEILGMPETQINMSNPISMVDLEEVAGKTSLAKDEKTMSLDNPFTKFKMQEQNMVGREVIGIGAVSLKHYFEVSTFFNSQLEEAEKDIENYERTGIINSEGLLDDIIDICFDNKFDGSIITLANLDFKHIKELIYRNPNLKQLRINKDLREKYKGVGKDALFSKHDSNGNLIYQGFITVLPSGESVVDLENLVLYLDKQSNGTWDAPIDGAFALSQLITAATDNAKALILAKINATTKFADVWTYLLTTGMRVSEIGKIMTSPIFNVIAEYAQGNIYNRYSRSVNLESAIKFVLNEQTLYRGINSKFTTLLTYIGNTNEAFTNISDSLLLKLSLQTNAQGGIQYDGTDFKEKPNNVLRRWWESQQPQDANLNVGINQILKDVEKVVANKWNKEKFDYTEAYKSLVAAVYNELETNPEAMQTLLSMLSDNIGDSVSYSVVDPELLLFADDSSFFDDPDMFSADYGEDVEEGVDEYNGKLDTASARTFYRYVTMQLIPKNQKIGIMTEEDRKTMKTLLDKVIPAMQEQQMNGQILGVNQGLKTKDYDEYNWVRKIENFVNQRYIKSDALEVPVPFSLFKFLTDKAYQTKQIEQYEQVKSTVNILKSVLKTPHYKEMFTMVSTNREMLQSSAALTIERELADRVMEESKSKAKATPTYDGISTGYFYKLNQKEYKALQRVVSDALIFNFLRSLDGLRLDVPKGQTYYNSDGSPTKNGTPTLTFKDANEMASFKRLMDDYIIPKLIEQYGNDNQFFGNLTTGFKRDPITGTPMTFYKLSFNLSDVAKSTKLQNLYDGVAGDFNKVLNTRVTFLHGNWTIGDLFYLYNLIVHKEGIGGDSFTKLFDEMALTNNRYSLLNAYKDYLGKIDSGEYRWKDSSKDPGSSRLWFGDHFVIDLRDVRYRLCLGEESEKKLRVKRTVDDKGNVTKMEMTDTDNKSTGKFDEVDMSKINKSDYTFNLYFTSKMTTQISSKPIHIQENVRVQNMNSTEILTAIVDNLKARLGGNVPIHIIHTDELQDEDFPFKYDARMASAIGFMVDGHVFINPENFKAENSDDIGAPVHELMHIVCAAMKYGNRSQKTLYYNLLKTIDQGDERWKEFYEDMSTNYEDLVGSDLKEEVLVRALTKAFVDGFRTEWDSVHDESLRLHNVGLVVKSILEDLLSVQFEGETDIETIVRAPLGEVLAVFNSQFMGSDIKYAIHTVIPTNQKLARLKKKMYDDKTLTFDGNC